MRLLAGINLALQVVAQLLLLTLGNDSLLGALLGGQLGVVVELVVLAEGGGVDLNDGVLDDRLCPDKLVVGSVVHNIENTALLGGDCKPAKTQTT